MAPAPTPAPFSLGLLCAYRQYKADTETIAAWLKANAVKHGYKFDGQDGTTIRTSDFIPSECLRSLQSLSIRRSFCLQQLHSIPVELEMVTRPGKYHFAHSLRGYMVSFSKES